ncbi:MAG: PqiC family protein [Syntrophales bacterium LBB04]|nr:PqiC family protein [Syntrophales bacterium LBB04]
MMKRLSYILTYCVFAVVIAGCASSSPSHFYTLSSTPAPAVTPQANYSVSVGPISVPAIVDQRPIVVRTGPNQVSIDEFNLWASPLKDDIGRVVALNLTTLLGTTQVTLFPQSTAADASYRTTIDILRFDSEPGKAATLDALWTVSSAKGAKSFRGRTTLTEATQGGDYTALAAAHSRALGQLSADIAKKIQEMEAQKP